MVRDYKLYQQLGVSTDAMPNDLKKAYKMLALKRMGFNFWISQKFEKSVEICRFLAKVVLKNAQTINLWSFIIDTEQIPVDISTIKVKTWA